MVLGVILRGTVPRNGLGKNNHPKAPSQPQTDLWKMGEVALLLPISQAAMGKKVP